MATDPHGRRAKYLLQWTGTGGTNREWIPFPKEDELHGSGKYLWKSFQASTNPEEVPHHSAGSSSSSGSMLKGNTGRSAFEMGSESLPPQAPKATMRQIRLRRQHYLRERRRVWVKTEDEAGIFRSWPLGFRSMLPTLCFALMLLAFSQMPPTETSL